MVYKNLKINHVGPIVLALMIVWLGSALPASAGLHELNAAEAQAMIQDRHDDPDFVILDIRTPAEYRQGHIDGALSIDYYNPRFKADLDLLDRTKTYLVYCRSGNRSGKAMKLFAEMGFTSVYHLSHGILEWQARGLKLVPTS